MYVYVWIPFMVQIARLQQGIQGQLQQYPNANTTLPARSGVAALAVPVSERLTW